MTRYIDLYWHFLIQRLKVLMEYCVSFIRRHVYHRLAGI
jgi:hypothetical protein